MAKAIALTPKQIKHVFTVTELMTHSEAKCCALAFSFAAMRVTEIALLDTKTILYQSGKIRNEIHLPAEICKRLKSRTIWITNDKTRQLLQEWIDYRLKRRWGTVIDGDSYQGLNPRSKFLYNNRGTPYALTLKKRKAADGKIVDYYSSDSLIDLFRKVYKKAGIKSASSHSGRKSLVSTGIAKHGRTLYQMALILGHDDSSVTLDYVDFDRNYLKRAYEIVS